MHKYLKLKEVFKNKWFMLYRNEQPHKVILKLKEAFGEDSSWLFSQLQYSDKVKDKLPLWFDNQCGITVKSYEQSSSQATATYKSTLINGDILLDLCGGLGVDDTYFSKCFKKVVSLDPDDDLNDIVKFNNIFLNIENIVRKTIRAEDFLGQNSLKFDWVYADADRRNDIGSKIKLESSSPDILSLTAPIFDITNQLLLKLSPMIDLTDLKKKVPFLKHIYVVSLKNEVKEILTVSEKNFLGEVSVSAVAIDYTGLPLNIYSNTADISIEDDFSTTHQEYIYDPDVALAKSGLWMEYAQKNNIKPLSLQSVYALSPHNINSFFGRKFICKSVVPFNKKEVKAYFKTNHITKANITRKNFVLKVDEIRQVFKMEDGGDDYLFFTTDGVGRKIMLHGVKA
jgi:hypothetical protein